MTYAGLPPAAVLKAATINGARALGVDDRLGSIEVGKLADLYVVRGNPLDDIKVARDIRRVFRDGVALGTRDPAITERIEDHFTCNFGEDKPEKLHN